MTTKDVAPGASAGNTDHHGERVFATIPTRRGEELRIAFSEFKGRTYLAVRIWYADDNGEMKPSGKGVNIKIDHLPAIADAINKALAAARADGLIE